MAEDKVDAQTEEAAEERELLSAPIRQTFNKYSLITLKGMVAQILMVVVEGVIIGTGLGSHGLACTGIIMSVQYINLAFGNLFGMGAPTVVGNYLGAGDTERAQKAFSQSFWFALYVGLAILAVFELFTPQLAVAFGATPDILDDTVVGIRMFGLLLPCAILGQMLTAVLRVVEKPDEAANIMMVSSIISAAFLASSTFLFHFGVAGAGLYYGMALGIWAVAVSSFVGKDAALQIRREDMRLDWKVCGEIVKIGTPFFLVQCGTFVYTIVANVLLGTYGDQDASLYIAAFSIISGYVLYIVSMVAESFVFGMQPIAAVNAGAKAYERLKELLRTSMVTMVGVLAVLTVVLWVAAYPVCGFFAAGDPALTPIAADATRVCILACCLGLTSMMMSTYFQTVEKVALATVLGLSRYVVFSVPLMFLMGNVMGIDGIWWALVLADICTGSLNVWCAEREERRLSKLSQEA